MLHYTKHAAVLFAVASFVLTTATGHQAAAASAASLGSSTEYFEVSSGGKACGSGWARRSETASGITIASDVLFEFGALGSPLDIRATSAVQYELDGVTPLSMVETIQKSGAMTTFRCRFHGRTVDVSAETGGTTQHTSYPVPAGVFIDNGSMRWGWQAMFKGRPGSQRSFEIHCFSPMFGAPVLVSLKRLADENYSVRGISRRCNVWGFNILGQDERMYLDPATGDIVKVDNLSEQLSVDVAAQPSTESIQRLDLTSRFMAPVDVALPDPSLLKQVRLHVHAEITGETITPAQLQLSPYQSFTGAVKDDVIDGTFTDTALHYSGANSPSFPYAPRIVAGQRKWLQPDYLAESGNSAICKLGRQLSAGCKTGWDAASGIARWVNKNIAYKITGSSAAACLSAREGDCGPHSNLTVALCRSIGIPARLAGGALYTDLLGGSYGQHYWTLVWMGAKDGWIPVDSTTGDIGYLPPTHLTLWHLAGLKSITVSIQDYAPKPDKTAGSAVAMKPAGLANGLTAGYSESYRFKMGGEDIGTQTASLDSVSDGNQAWSFHLSLRVPQAGQLVRVTEDGTFNLAMDSTPKALHVDIGAAGTKQTVDLTWSGSNAAAHMVVGSSVINRTVDVSSERYALLGNNITLMSLALRSSPRNSGKSISLPCLAVEALSPLTLTLSPTPSAPPSPERGTSGSGRGAGVDGSPGRATSESGTGAVAQGSGVSTQPASAVAGALEKYQVSPLGVELDVDPATGAIVKLTDRRQQLVVTRDPPTP